MRRVVFVALWILCLSRFATAQTIYWKKDYLREPNGNLVGIATPFPTDYTPPSVPTGLAVGTTTTTTVPLSWSPVSGSDFGGYLVYRGEIPIASLPQNSSPQFTDDGLRPNTSYTYRIVAFDKSHNYSGFSSDVTGTTVAATGDPTNLVVTTQSSSAVHLSWSAPGSGAPDHYRISTWSGGSWSTVTTTSSTTYDHTGRSANTAYLYRVAAENNTDVPQGYSQIELATTTVFTDSTITAHSTNIKAVHITELRTAVNAVRALAGLAAVSWTDSSLNSSWVRAIHVLELRDGLGEAINLLGLPARNYTGSSLVSGEIKKAHIVELRKAVKGKHDE